MEAQKTFILRGVDAKIPPCGERLDNTAWAFGAVLDPFVPLGNHVNIGGNRQADTK